MSGELREFHPDTVAATWNLRLPVVDSVDMTPGLVSEDGAISEAPDGPESSRRTDRQGNTTRNRLLNRSGAMDFTYMANAPIHNKLGKLLKLDRAGQSVVGDLVIEDFSTGDSYTLLGAHFEQRPTFSAGATRGDKVWRIGYSKLIVNEGGSEAL